MSWAILVCAGLLEIVWAAALKASDGLARPLFGLVALVAMLASVGLLGLSMRTLPLGTAYVVWTGIGAVGAFAFGALAFGEAADPLRIAGAGLIVIGGILMKLAE